MNLTDEMLMMNAPPPETLSVPVWVSIGGIMYRRDALSPSHPESKYNYIKRTYPYVNPEDYGIFNPSLETDPYWEFFYDV